MMRRSGVFVSAVIHVTLIAAAVTATARRGDTHPVPPPPTLIYTIPNSGPSGPHTSTSGGPVHTGQIQFNLPTIKGIPPIDANLPSGPSIGLDTVADFRASVTGTGDGPIGTQDDGIKTNGTVDVVAAPLPGAPSPQYPDALREAGIEAHLMLQFVVDTTGRAELASIRATQSDAGTATTDAFVRSIRQALSRTRYRPALIAGHAVRQLVEQPFVFAITR